MRSSMPILICDAGDSCGVTATDFYTECADTVDGIRITSSMRHPGWVSDEYEDFCPDHAPTKEGQADE